MDQDLKFLRDNVYELHRDFFIKLIIKLEALGITMEKLNGEFVVPLPAIRGGWWNEDYLYHTAVRGTYKNVELFFLIKNNKFIARANLIKKRTSYQIRKLSKWNYKRENLSSYSTCLVTMKDTDLTILATKFKKAIDASLLSAKETLKEMPGLV